MAQKRCLNSPEKEKSAPRKNKCIEVGNQKAFIHWLWMQYPSAKAVTFAIPNGGKRTTAEGKHQRELGLTAGIPDIFMSIAAQGFHGLYIEMKRKDGALTYHQIDAIQKLTEEGYKCVVCHSTIEAIDQVKEYLKDTKHVRPRSTQTTYSATYADKTWTSNARMGRTHPRNVCPRV